MIFRGVNVTSGWYFHYHHSVEAFSSKDINVRLSTDRQHHD